MRFAIAAGAIAVLCNGCASYFSATTLDPTGPGTYRFTAPATSYEWPLDDPHWEAERVAALDRRMRMNGFCPAGYRVADRTPVLTTRAPLGDVYTVIYSVACTR